MKYDVHSQDVEGMLSISVEATAARNSLSDEKELINTYEVEILLGFDIILQSIEFQKLFY